MGYHTYNTMRLQGRDLIFITRYILEKTFSRTKTKPLILCNYYPKSGTHLLYQILYSLPELRVWDDIVSVQALCGIMNTTSHIRWKIGSAPKNSIVRSHLMYCNQIRDILQ